MTKKIKIFSGLDIRLLNIILGLSVVFSVAFYLFMISNVSMAGYQKDILQRNIDNLRMEIRGLNLELADKRSIGFLEKAAQDLNLVNSNQIQYVKIAGPVAKNP